MSQSSPDGAARLASGPAARAGATAPPWPPPNRPARLSAVACGPARRLFCGLALGWSMPMKRGLALAPLAVAPPVASGPATLPGAVCPAGGGAVGLMLPPPEGQGTLPPEPMRPPAPRPNWASAPGASDPGWSGKPLADTPAGWEMPAGLKAGAGGGPPGGTMALLGIGGVGLAGAALSAAMSSGRGPPLLALGGASPACAEAGLNICIRYCSHACWFMPGGGWPPTPPEPIGAAPGPPVGPGPPWRAHQGRLSVRSVTAIIASVWLQGRELNPGPSGYEPDELPGCSTLRHATAIAFEVTPVDDPAAFEAVT